MRDVLDYESDTWASLDGDLVFGSPHDVTMDDGDVVVRAMADQPKGYIIINGEFAPMPRITPELRQQLQNMVFGSMKVGE